MMATIANFYFSLLPVAYQCFVAATVGLPAKMPTARLFYAVGFLVIGYYMALGNRFMRTAMPKYFSRCRCRRAANGSGSIAGFTGLSPLISAAHRRQYAAKEFSRSARSAAGRLRLSPSYVILPAYAFSLSFFIRAARVRFYYKASSFCFSRSCATFIFLPAATIMMMSNLKIAASL